MKRFRLVDTPLIIKIGFAPAFALVMLACLATGAIILQRAQSAELRQVVQVDMPNSLRMQKVSERITAIHGQLYFLLTHQAASIDVDKIEGESQAMLAEVFDGLLTTGGAHARSAVGVAELPANSPVEVEMIVLIKE